MKQKKGEGWVEGQGQGEVRVYVLVILPKMNEIVTAVEIFLTFTLPKY